MTAHQFNRYFLNYRASLTRKAVCLCRTFDDAEDLVQETYTRAFASIGELKRDDSVRIWLNRIMLNIHFNNLRSSDRTQLYRKGMRLVPMKYEPADSRFLPSLPLIVKEQTRFAHRLLRTLPADRRRLIIRREFLGHSDEDLARREGIAPETVRTRVYRSLSRLKKRGMRPAFGYEILPDTQPGAGNLR